MPTDPDVESRYRAVVEQSADAIVVIEGTTCVYANDAYLHLVGVTDRSQVIGQSGDTWLHPDDRRLVNDRALARQRGEPVPPRYEFRVIRTEGDVRTVEVAATLITHSGKPATLAVLRDVTERKRADEDLQRLSTALRRTAEARDAALAEANAERARLHALFNQAPALIAVTRGAEHLVELANPAFLRTVGIRNIIGRPMGEAIPELAGQGLIECLDRALANGEPSQVRALPARIDRNGDGRFDSTERGFFDVVFQPYRDAGGRVLGVMIHAVEVTEQVRSREALAESEARLRLALRAARMGIWDWDVRTGRVTWSEEVERLHGMAPGTYDGSYEAWIERVHPEDREKVTAAIERSLRERAPYDLLLRVVWLDGTVHTLAASGQPVFDEAGAPARMLGATHEVHLT